MSESERITWANLVAKLVAGIWYFSYVLSLPAGVDLSDPGIAKRLVWPIIVVGLVSGTMLRAVQKRTGGGIDAAQRDERDDLITLRATRIAYGVFGVAVGTVFILVMPFRPQHFRLGTGESLTTFQLLGGKDPLQVMHVAQLLLLALLLASITLSASRIFYYRRGY